MSRHSTSKAGLRDTWFLYCSGTIILVQFIIKMLLQNSKKKQATYGRSTNKAISSFALMSREQHENSSTSAAKYSTIAPDWFKTTKRISSPLPKPANSEGPEAQLPNKSHEEKTDQSDVPGEGLKMFQHEEDDSDESGSSLYEVVSTDEEDRGDTTTQLRKRRKLTPKSRTALKAKEVVIAEAFKIQPSLTNPQSQERLKVDSRRVVNRQAQKSQYSNDRRRRRGPRSRDSLSPRTPEAISRSSSPSSQLQNEFEIEFRAPGLTSRFQATRNVNSRQTGTESPSRIDLRSLRLGPQKTDGIDSTSETNAPEEHTRQSRHASGRRRLIDVLDSPRKLSLVRLGARDETADVDITGDTRHVGIVDNTLEPVADPHASNVPLLPISSSNRVTYGKQRSHLKSMVDEIESIPPINDLNAGLPGQILQTEISGITRDSSTQSSQVSVEDDGDGTGPRSIHALRQAGALRRFQSDFETIFDDLEARLRSPRSARIQALTDLSRKLSIAGSRSRFIEYKMDERLADCLFLEQDTLLDLLASVVVLQLLQSDKVSSRTISRILLKANESFPALLLDNRDLPKFVRDRKHNMSGAARQDVLFMFSKVVLESFEAIENQTPQMITAELTEQLFRRANSLESLDTIIGVSLFSSFTSVLSDRERSSKSLVNPAVITVLSALDFMLNALGSVPDEYVGSAMKLSTLGSILAETRYSKDEKATQVEQLALRVVITSTNNQMQLCEAFGKSSLPTSLMQIIEDGFPIISREADQAQDLDMALLNSVVLALGGLINIAEGSDHFRQNARNRDEQQKDFLIVITGLFESRRDLAFEVSLLL